MNEYFLKLPEIIYANTACLDISRVVAIPNTTLSVATNFYPWEIRAGQRSDTLAYGYYKNPSYDWMIYLTNGIIDPYYGWYLSDEQFDAFIIDKYGSLREAKQRIKHYQLNWADETPPIPVSVFENNIPYDIRKYYVPKFGTGTRILSYQIRQEDWIVNTNRIVEFTVNLSSNSTFSNGEMIDIKYSGEIIGGGEVIVANDSVVIAQHISGNTSANNLILGQTSGANATITDTDILQQNLSDHEEVFWTPIYYYDWERDKNEQNKFVQLLDARFASDTNFDLQQQLKED